MKMFTNEVIKQELIESRPEGFTMAFVKDAPIEENECLLKIKKNGVPFGRLLVWRPTGDTVLWIDRPGFTASSHETPAGAMSRIKTGMLLGII